MGDLATKKRATQTTSLTISAVHGSPYSGQKKQVRSILQGSTQQNMGNSPAYGFGTIAYPPDYSSIQALDLKAEVIKFNAMLENKSISIEERYKAARNLTEIFHELSLRSTEQRDAEKPDYSNDIWKIYGGPGDPLIGYLDKFGIFQNIHKWQAVAREMGPESWSDEVVNAAYRSNSTGAARSTNFNKSVEEGRANIGKKKQNNKRDWAPAIKAASEWSPDNRHKAINTDFHITADEAVGLLGANNDLAQGERLIQNMLTHKKSALSVDQAKDKIANYIEKHIIPAFRIAKIDTIQAQSAYLAHWAGETKFGLFTESQNELFENDPHKISYNSGYGGAYDYARAYKNKGLDKKSYSKDLARKSHAVDPLGAIESKQGMRGKTQQEAAAIMNKTFVGRGAVQVTLDSNYTMALIYLEEILKTTKDEDDQALIKEALFKIKQDPSQAANPKYAFLFSAAYMHMSGGVKDTANLDSKVADLSFKGNTGNYMSDEQRQLFTWVSGGLNIVKFGRNSKGSVAASVREASAMKVRVYNNAFKILQQKLKAKKDKQRIEKEQKKLELERKKAEKKWPDRWPFKGV